MCRFPVRAVAVRSCAFQSCNVARHCPSCAFIAPNSDAKGRYALPVHTARTYGPYVRGVYTGVKNAPVYTGRKYGPYIRVLGTHYPYRIAVLYGPYIRAVYTGVKNTPVCTGRTYGPYIRAVFTGSAYRPLVLVLSSVILLSHQ